MKISLKWLGRYINVTAYQKDPDKLTGLLTNGGLEVEGIVNLAKAFENVVVGQILEKNKHPNADNLTLCLVAVGPAASDQRRIVCGAKNHSAGDKVVVALPGAVLPGDFTIKLSKIRGEESQGMLCSEKELGLSTESQGIVILPADAPIGVPFAQYSKNDDVIFDIKVTPNRSDCLSHFGLAREVSTLTGDKFEFPLTPFTEGRESTRKLIKVTVEDAERCPRYAGRVVQNVKIGPSPEWMKKLLESVGLRSINNVVDVTNFVMMELGQPLHAFDLATLEGPQIIVRRAHSGEKFSTLDEKELTLEGTELVICDAKRPVALAGVMGGLNSGVSEKTSDVFIESAYFLPSAVRRAARRHGLDTDSSYRFSRGVDPDAINLALNRACQLLMEVAGGTVCTDSYDYYPRPVAKPRIELDLAFISARLGVNVESIEAKRLLERTGCDVSGSGVKLLVNPPAYRSDLKIQEDLGEEILRLKGFSQIPETLPQMTGEPVFDSPQHFLEGRLAKTFASLGLAQATNLSFTQSKFENEFLGAAPRGRADELGLDLNVKSIGLTNPINQDLEVLRVSLVPSLARNGAFNLRHGRARGGLFEIAPVFAMKEMDDIRDEKRPFSEETHLGAILWGEDETHWAKPVNVPIYYRLKAILEGFLKSWQYKSFRIDPLHDVPAFLHPGQNARIFVEGKAVGFIGVLHPLVADRMEFKVPVAVMELNLKNLFAGQPRSSRAKPLPKFPTVERDVALLCPVILAAGEIRAELMKAGGQLVMSCEIFDLYEGEKLPPDKKSMAFRLVYQDPNKTLSDDDVNALHQKAVNQVVQKLGLSVR